MLNTKVIMALSAVGMTAIALPLIFIPDEILAFCGIENARFHSLFLQITGALYFAFAMLNWMAKGNPIGGIYSRPLVMSNLVHFLVGGLALLKASMSGNYPARIWILTAFYTVFAILFALISFTHPKQVSKKV
ncbi:MAG: hypothetical protein V4642_11610 [Bacteroidota bacterium]